MRRPPIRALLALTLGTFLATMPTAHAQTGGPYSLTWSTLAGGGGSISGASGYSVSGTIAQPNASSLTGGTYTLKGGFWNLPGASPVGVDDDQTSLPVAFRVYQNVPNPFSAQTTVAFELPTAQRVEMAVFNLNGERVRLLLDQTMPAGRHQLTWAGIGDDGRPLPSGIYWIKTRARNRSDVRKTVLVK